MKTRLGKRITEATVSILSLALSLCIAGGAELEFDHPSGFYQSEFRLLISTRIEGATIYYTTNGATPTPVSGRRYRKHIPVSETTILRAAAFQRDMAVTEVYTQTYLFIAAILKQDGANLPKVWGTNSGQFIPAHYAMSATDSASRQRIAEGLQSLPVLSIVSDREDLFSTQKGIYLHPLERGINWERPASVEMFDSRKPGGFQINCGLRIHGGMSRRPEESPKHSFRLLFKRRYGATELTSAVLGRNKKHGLDELVLRAGGSDCWLDSNGERRRQATYIRDEWMRQAMADMGYPSARGQFVHVFLNGLYWGVYNMCERPIASLQTPSPGGYDVLNAHQTESGDHVAWNALMTLANSGVGDTPRYEAVSGRLDLTQFADYLILNFYAGNSDWDRSSNWYAIRPRVAGGRFQFSVWDAERTFGEIDADTTGLDDEESPMRLFHKLSENPTFRELFATRAQHLLLRDGPLAGSPAAQRFRRLADSIEPALAAESARWGNYRATVHPFKTGPFETLTVNEHWQREIRRILSEYNPNRRDVLLRQLRERGLFPETTR